MLKKTCLVIGLVLGLVAAVLLFEGSKGVPWEMQSFGGKTEKEIAFRKNRQSMTRWGFGFLGLSFIVQLIGVCLKE